MAEPHTSSDNLESAAAEHGGLWDLYHRMPKSTRRVVTGLAVTAGVAGCGDTHHHHHHDDVASIQACAHGLENIVPIWEGSTAVMHHLQNIPELASGLDIPARPVPGEPSGVDTGPSKVETVTLSPLESELSDIDMRAGIDIAHAYESICIDVAEKPSTQLEFYALSDAILGMVDALKHKLAVVGEAKHHAKTAREARKLEKELQRTHEHAVAALQSLGELQPEEEALEGQPFSSSLGRTREAARQRIQDLLVQNPVSE